MQNPEIIWQPGSPRSKLGDREIHVWAASLSPTPEKLKLLAQALTPDEMARATRYLREQDHARFIAGRGQLRHLLGHYLDCAPGELAFEFSARGKPELAGLEPGKSLEFNLAHSENLVLYAITRHCPVGVDVEWVRPMKDAGAIAERFFSAQESAGLRTLPENEQLAAFFRLWTRKEAWLKATSQGIAEALNQVEVTYLPDEPARLTRLFGETKDLDKWKLWDLSPASNYAAALAAPDSNLAVLCWNWIE